ncbi:MAG TPA: hypothetical protein PKA19_13540 [Bacillota bacterium]|nr:hypothetical protein [Bacillota bacterium]
MENWKSDNWWVSKYNYDKGFRESLDLPRKVTIHDATLRDGEQTPGVVMSIDEKVEIAKMLDNMGIERIEAGMPAVSETDKEAIKRIASLGLKAKIFSFCRGNRKDIDMAVECGVDGVVIEMPAGRPKLEHQFTKWSDDDVIDISLDTVKYAKSKGLYTVYFGYDTTRADMDFLKRLYDKVILEGKPDSVGIVDTMGCILPGAVKELVRKIKTMYDIKVEIHTHNDFGLAVGSSFGGVEGGAEVIHTSINGMGERTGNAPLEPIAVGLKTLYGYDVPYKLNELKGISDRVQEITNFRKAVNQPIVGDNVYIRESGIGIDLVLEKPLAMFAVTPELSGNAAGIVLGKKSGIKSVEVKLAEYNITCGEEQKRQILDRIKDLSISTKSLVGDEAFLEIVKALTEGEKVK